MRKGFSIFISCVFFAGVSWAQNYDAPVDPKLLLQQATPVGPDVATLGRFAMSPPNLSNGLPQQNINLFEIKENGLSYPVTLFYNYSGFRLNEEASSYGLGWGATEASIVRIVKHVPDDHHNLMKKFGDFGSELSEERGYGATPASYYYYTCALNDFSYTANRIHYKLYDAQPDVYAYSFGGYSGKFFWINGEAIQLTHSDIKIEGEVVENLLIFYLTTPDGIRYKFTEADRTTSDPASIVRPTMCAFASPIETYVDYGYTTAWRVREIKNTVTQAIISFSYSSNTVIQVRELNQISSVTFAAPQNVLGNFFTTDFRRDEQYGKTITFNYYVTTIESEHFKAVFTLNPRSDGDFSRVAEIKLYNKSNLSTPLKTITFLHEYFGDISDPKTCWLKLKKVQVRGAGVDNEYEFSYISPFYPNDTFDKRSYDIDHWGYANGAGGNLTLMPYTAGIQAYIQNESSLNPATIIPAWANRDPNISYSQTFALEKVIYPTKGFTKITYQSAAGRGIRVASQEDNDGNNSMYRYYNYQDAGFTYPANYSYEEYYTYICCPLPYNSTTRIRIYSSTPDASADFFVSTDNFYEEVIESIGTIDGQGGKTKYKYTRLNGFGNEVKLIEKTDYKFGSVQFVKKEKYNYTSPVLKTINIWQVPTMLNMIVSPGICSEDPSGRPSCGPQDPEKGYVLLPFYLNTQQVYAVWTRLESVETTINNVTTTKNFTYKPFIAEAQLPLHTQPIKVEEPQSNSLVKKTYLYYPGEPDPDNTSITLGIPEMWNSANANYKHFISPVIKLKSFVDAKLAQIETTQYTYESSTGNILRVGYEKLPKGSIADKEAWSFNYDDRANLISISKQNDISQAFVWGYNKSYPIAQVTNAIPNQIAFTSFETEEAGGWEINPGSFVTTAQSHIGNRSFAGVVRKTIPTGNYIVTLWSNIYGVTTVNGQVGAPGVIVGIWRFYTWNLNGVANVEIAASNMDDVRLYPSGAQMTTYTYDPLFGITSQTDLNNRSTFYEYDNFGRLLRIRDEQNNIVKQFEYKYDAFAHSNPVWENTGVTRCKPCPADGNYFTSILQQQQKDINSNSSTYGNLVWIDAGTSTSCAPLADWQNDGTPYCEAYGYENTGNQLQQQRDINPCSNNYNQTRVILSGYNTTACPLPNTCNSGNCSMEGYKCINNNCEYGFKLYTNSYYDWVMGGYYCTYHYEWSDGTWSQDYTVFDYYACPF